MSFRTIVQSVVDLISYYEIIVILLVDLWFNDCFHVDYRSVGERNIKNCVKITHKYQKKGKWNIIVIYISHSYQILTVVWNNNTKYHHFLETFTFSVIINPVNPIF